MGHEGMKSSLVSREVIANSVELTMRGHCYDALVGLAGCDKSLPGADDGDGAAQRAVGLHVWRLDPARPLQRQGRDDRRRLRGGRRAQRRQADATRNLHELECVACPSSGSCGGLFTANTMACVSEAIGLALPGSAGAPAPYDSRDAYAEASGQAVMELLRTQPPAARHRHPQGARERRDGRRRRRRLDQCRAAPAGDRERGRHRIRPARCRRDLQAHALYRRSEAGRPLRDEGSPRDRRRADPDEGIARRRLPARRLHDRHRQDDRREPRECPLPDRARTWCARPRTRSRRPAGVSC